MSSAIASFAEGRMLAETHGGVGIVTFNHPEKHNAITVEMWEGLGEIMGRLDADDLVRVVVLRGAGERAFASGGDISQFGETRANYEVQQRFATRVAAARQAIARCSKPTIAAIHGYCLGGGLNIALQADLRLATEDSIFGIPAARLGIAYGFDGLRTLTALVGPAHARMIMFSADRIDAVEAARMGLINRTLPVSTWWNDVIALAERIADNAPISIAAAKAGIEQALRDPSERNMDLLDAFQRRSLDSEDYREGRNAFLEKRKPRFTGR
ncbi:MAG: enoyl-CoA hydratase/isomerase family protein [Rhodospirillales bacterium]|nr:enoyl-CoA hydratase/isomerase family protein [Rhodospirillales bacterium]